MLLIWGRWNTRKRLGRVAAFCAICKEGRPHRMWAVGSIPYFYFIPIGRNRIERHEVECEVCGTTRAEDPDLYRAASKDADADLHTLIAETRPGFEEELAGRLALEDRARSGSLGAKDRWDVLAEPFQALELEAAKRAASMHLDARAVLCIAITLVTLLALILLAFDADHATQTTLLIVAASVAAAGFLYFFYSVATDASRFARRVLQPRLVRALVPLRPTRDELEEVFQALRSKKYVLGRKLTLHRLWEDLQGMREGAPIEPS